MRCKLRKKLYEIIEVSNNNGTLSHVYDIFMILTISVSLIPLGFKEPPEYLIWAERITTLIFIIDYLFRLATADIKLKKGYLSFLIYPFTAMAIIDLLSILPSLLFALDVFRILRAVRLVRALRVLKIFKSFRYSKNVLMIASVFKRQRRSLATVGILAIGYILISALLVFNIEPETFDTFFDALYWATVSLTTVGYGDIYTVSLIGRIVTMISSIFGVAIVALPAGIITAGYMAELNHNEEDESEDNAESKEG